MCLLYTCKSCTFLEVIVRPLEINSDRAGNSKFFTTVTAQIYDTKEGVGQYGSMIFYTITQFSREGVTYH